MELPDSPLDIDTDALQVMSHTIAAEHGFHNPALYANTEPWRMFAWSALMLVVTELAEAAEVLRDAASIEDLQLVGWVDGKPDGFPVELADTIIRILDTAEELGLPDILHVAKIKGLYNNRRPKMHGRGR
jgi:hypothetical protein